MARKKFEPYTELVKQRRKGEIDIIKSEVKFEQALRENGFVILGYKHLYNDSIYLVEKEDIALEARHSRGGGGSQKVINCQIAWVIDCFEMKKKR